MPEGLEDLLKATIAKKSAEEIREQHFKLYKAFAEKQSQYVSLLKEREEESVRHKTRASAGGRAKAQSYIDARIIFRFVYRDLKAKLRREPRLKELLNKLEYEFPPDDYPFYEWPFDTVKRWFTKIKKP